MGLTFKQTSSLVILCLSCTCLKSWWMQNLIIFPKHHMNNTTIASCLGFTHSVAGEKGGTPKWVKQVSAWTLRVSKDCSVSKLNKAEILKCPHVPVSQQLQWTLHKGTPHPHLEMRSLVAALGTSASRKRQDFGGAFFTSVPRFRLTELEFWNKQLVCKQLFFTKIKYYSFKKHFHNKHFNMHRFNVGKLVCVYI